MSTSTTLPVLHSGLQVPIAGVDYELRLPKGHLSYSQISKYMQCPQQYYRDNVIGGEQMRNSAAFEGEALAHTLELVGMNKLQRKKPPTMVALLKRWNTYWDKNKGAVTDWNRAENEFAGRAQQMLKLFMEQESDDLIPVLHENKPGVECEFEVTIAGVPVHGKADIVENKFVWDYKVTGNPRFLDVEKSLQLTLYAHVFQRESVGYIIFDWSRKALQIEQRRAERDLNKAARWLDVVVSGVAMAISQGSFPVCDPAKNFLCSENWCGHWSTCRGMCV